jgi:hypothetical protein
MTVAIGTEMEPGGQIAPAQGQTVASTPGKAPGAEGFRSSWQSFLASLGEGMAGNVRQGAVSGEADTAAATTQRKNGDWAGDSSSGAGSNLRARPAKGQEENASADRAIKSSEGAQAGISTRRPNGAAGRQASVNPGARELTATSAAKVESAAASSDDFEAGSANRSGNTGRGGDQRNLGHRRTGGSSPGREHGSRIDLCGGDVLSNADSSYFGISQRFFTWFGPFGLGFRFDKSNAGQLHEFSRQGSCAGSECCAGFEQGSARGRIPWRAGWGSRSK